VLRSANVSSKVPAAPWDPTTVVTRSRAAQASPGRIEDVVVDELDELPVEDVDAVVGVGGPGDEHAARATAATAPETTLPVHRRGRCRVEVLRS